MTEWHPTHHPALGQLTTAGIRQEALEDEAAQERADRRERAETGIREALSLALKTAREGHYHDVITDAELETVEIAAIEWGLT